MRKGSCKYAIATPQIPMPHTKSICCLNIALDQHV